MSAGRSVRKPHVATAPATRSTSESVSTNA